MRGLLILVLASLAWSAELPEYTPRQWVSGHLRCAGSETMDLLLARWSEAFGRIHPGWFLEVDGKGSRVGLRVLASAGADLATFSRMPVDSEFSQAGMRGGQRPRLIVVGYDSLRFLWRREIHRESTGLLGAYSKAAGARPIGRNLSSGTRAEAQLAMGQAGDFGAGVRSLSSPSQVAQAVVADPAAVGYGSAGWRLARLESRGLLLRVRPLVLAVPSGVLRPAVAEFLAYVLSRSGQDQLRRDGFCPVAVDSVLAWRRGLGFDG